MRTLSITIADDLFTKLKRHIPQGQISKFISGAIKEKIDIQESDLHQAYIQAEADSARKSEIKEWENIDGDDWS